MTIIEQMNDESSEKSMMDILVEATAVVLEKKYPHIAHNQDELEELLDIQQPTLSQQLAVLDMSNDNPHPVSPPGTA